MARYSDELIEEIRSNNDIVDIISQYVVLKRSGRNYFGLCPFHKEKSPSFSVSADRQYFHCFGCHNPETWTAEGSKEITPEEVLKKFKKFLK